MNIRHLALWATLALALCPARAADTSSLRLIAHTEQASVELGEPIYLTVRLHNSGASTVEVAPRLEPEDGHLSVLVEGPAGRTVGYLPLSVRDALDDAAHAQLAAGQSISTTLPIFFGASGWVFTAPGVYRVRASYRISPDAALVESSLVTIDVKQVDADLRSLFSNDEASDEAGRFLVWRAGDHLTKARTLLKALTERFPETHLRDHYRVAEARSWSHRFRDYIAGSVREADFAQALQALQGVREDQLPASVRVEKLLAEAISLRAVGQAQAANAALMRASALVEIRDDLGGYLQPVHRLRQEMGAPPGR